MGQSLPAPIAPMLATPGVLPLGRPGWAFELKWDGFRALVRVAGDQIRIDSRSGRDLTAHYPELVDLPDALGGRRGLVLDGELVVLDEAQRPSFELMQQRLRPHPSGAVLAAWPVLYLVFDVLFVDGVSLLGVTYLERRRRLESLPLRHDHVRVPPAWPAQDGQAVLDVAHDRDLEGVVAKRLASRYYPGRRSRDWVKAAFRHTTEVVVGGWTPGQGHRRDTIGAVLVGAHDVDGGLVYLGKVGSGLSEAGIRALQDQFAGWVRADSPFVGPVPRGDSYGVVWVDPVLVGEVQYRELTLAGRRLRHPVWRGIRADRTATTVKLP